MMTKFAMTVFVAMALAQSALNVGLLRGPTCGEQIPVGARLEVICK